MTDLYEDYENEDVDNGEDFDDSDDFEWGCQDPDNCVMPGEHMLSECHTAEMLMAQEREMTMTDRLEEIKRQHWPLDKTDHLDAGLGYCAKCWLIAEVERLRQDIESYKKVHKIRGQALFHPCLNCGYQPRKVTLADGSTDERFWQSFHAEWGKAHSPVERSADYNKDARQLEREKADLEKQTAERYRCKHCHCCREQSHGDLQQIIANLEAQVCGMREALDKLLREYESKWSDDPESVKAARQALSSASQCPHQEQLATLQAALDEANGRVMEWEFRAVHSNCQHQSHSDIWFCKEQSESERHSWSREQWTEEAKTAK